MSSCLRSSLILFFPRRRTQFFATRLRVRSCHLAGRRAGGLDNTTSKKEHRGGTEEYIRSCVFCMPSGILPISRLLLSPLSGRSPKFPTLVTANISRKRRNLSLAFLRLRYVQDALITAFKNIVSLSLSKPAIHFSPFRARPFFSPATMEPGRTDDAKAASFLPSFLYIPRRSVAI